MFVNTSANVIVDRPAAEVFDFATDMENFHKVFTGWGPIPGNKSVEQLDRGKPKPGSRRRILNTDGSVVLEEIHQFSRPTAHRYRIIGGLPLPLRALVNYADAAWYFKQVDGGTSITWEYKFKLINIAALPATIAIVKIPFQRAMQRCLNNVRIEIEKVNS